jgi:spore coat polysaccharide biosynthesis protein SpsF
MSPFKTDQEEFWAGEFGTDYVTRNNQDQIVAGNLALFSRALSKVVAPKSIIEFGANIGLNLRALAQLFPHADLRGIEINPRAALVLKDLIGSPMVFEGSILDYEVTDRSELVLVKGVLIHQNPDFLHEVYGKLYEASSRYIFVCEYFNPTPVSVNYRGFEDRLFKRDFAGELLERYSDLRLVDYGFVYHRDPSFPLDDVTWFLLEKSRDSGC